MTHHTNILPQKKPVKQPAANPPRVQKPAPKEKTPAEIVEEKMAAMAAHPDAVTVYQTEKGIDAKGWHIMNPEYKIFDDALRGGYGWWDLTEGAGRHLLPKPRPYKIVKVTSAELAVIRAKEAAEEAAAAEEAKAAKEAEFDGYRAAAAAKAAAEAERKAMEAEDARASEIRLAEWKAAQTAQAKEAERLSFISVAVEVLLDMIKALPEHLWTQSYLVDYIVDNVTTCPQDMQDPIIAGICTAVEKEHLIFYTPVCSPELAPMAEPALAPASLELTAPSVPMPAQLLSPPEDSLEFVKQPPFNLFGTLYTPIAFLNGLRAYIPVAMLESILRQTLCAQTPAAAPVPVPEPAPACGPDCATCFPPPATPPPPPPQTCGPDCLECNPPPPPLPRDCGFADCNECYPAPPPPPPSLPAKLPPLLPTPTTRPLPVVQARLVPTPTTELMKNVKIRKMRMPNMKRLKHLLISAK